MQASSAQLSAAGGERGGWIGGGGDGPTDHQLTGAGGNRLGRRQHTLLIAMGGAGRPDAGRNQGEGVGVDRPQRFNLER